MLYPSSLTDLRISFLLGLNKTALSAIFLFLFCSKEEIEAVRNHLVGLQRQVTALQPRTGLFVKPDSLIALLCLYFPSH